MGSYTAVAFCLQFDTTIFVMTTTIADDKKNTTEIL